MKRLGVLLLVLGVVATPAVAQSYFFSPDVPTDLSGTTYLPWNIVRNDSGVYSLVLGLPNGTPIDALHAMDAGDWLFSVEATTELPPGSSVFFLPGDVGRTDGAVFGQFFCGNLVGIPAGSNVDSAFLVNGDHGDLVIGFDVPTDLTPIGGSIYDPADLVVFARTGAGCGGWTLSGLYFDASAAAPAVPVQDDVTGSDDNAGLLLLGWDVPVTLGPTFLTGEITSWDGAAFASFYLDPSWPIASRVNALSCLANPGNVGTTLRVDKSTTTPGDLTLSWAPSCSVGAEDYGIYEGTIASLQAGLYDHTRIDCVDDGANLTEEVTPPAASAYYLLVSHNDKEEGSYGTDFDSPASVATERPVGTTVCQSPQNLSPCP